MFFYKKIPNHLDPGFPFMQTASAKTVYFYVIKLIRKINILPEN
jgi:hypothetical protein